ncbi:sensor histidine kinase [Nannocystaceae bacterium ST9]
MSEAPISAMRGRLARVRLALAGAGVLLLSGLALLLARALEAGEREQALREQALIARVFDELEGTLATFVATEQARPFVQWRHFWVAPGAAIASLSTDNQVSPLARVQPQRPWLIGYYQVEPDGRFVSPLVPPEGEQALADDLRERLALLREHASPPTRLAQADSNPPIEPPPQAQRKQLPQQAQLPQDIQIQRALDQQSNSRLNSLINDDNANLAPDYAQISNFLGSTSLGNADADELAPREDELDVRVEPFVAREIDERWIDLSRQVWIGERRWTQGMLLDRPELEAWLEAQVLGSPELAAAIALDWHSDEASPEYRHEFAEPFAMLGVDASLRAAIGETEGQRFVILLGVLLALALIAVLIAVDRTLATLLARAEERERFIAAVTHELRTPLTSIRMYSEMLEQGMIGDPKRQSGYHRTIRSEAERLSRLVEQILTLARLDQASGAPRVDEPAPLAEIVAGVIELLRPQAEQRGLVLAVDLEPGVAGLALPRDALTQVLTNLIDNAIKFSDAGAGPIELRASPTGKGVRLVVGDRGPGVEPELLGRMFEPFVRGRRADESATPGTGIGLALVRSLVGELGGRISARPREGGGLELIVELTASER